MKTLNVTVHTVKYWQATQENVTSYRKLWLFGCGTEGWDQFYLKQFILFPNNNLSSRMFRFILLKLFDLWSLQTLTEHTLKSFKWRLLPVGHQQSSPLCPFDTAIRCCCCRTTVHAAFADQTSVSVVQPAKLWTVTHHIATFMSWQQTPLWRLNMDDLFKYTCSWSLGDEFRVNGWVSVFRAAVATTKRWSNLQTRPYPQQ